MNTPLSLKCFFRGRLELGSAKTFEKVKSHFLNRIETMYRADVFFTIENDFIEEEFAIELSRETMQLSDKTYKKSMELLRELSQYGIAGRIKGWAIDTGQIMSEDVIVPNNQKDAVVTYNEALELSSVPGNELRAIEMLNESLCKNERNPLAYDRRGFISYKMQNYADAAIDFNKSIAIFKNNPEPHFGLGRCYLKSENWEEAKNCFMAAIKASLPREPIYHTSKLYLGRTLYSLGEYKEAKIELEQFVNRKYDYSDFNNKKLYLGHKFLGKIYMKEGNDAKSLDHFNLALVLGQAQQSNLRESDIFPKSMNLMVTPPKKTRAKKSPVV